MKIEAKNLFQIVNTCHRTTTTESGRYSLAGVLLEFYRTDKMTNIKAVATNGYSLSVVYSVASGDFLTNGDDLCVNMSNLWKHRNKLKDKKYEVVVSIVQKTGLDDCVVFEWNNGKTGRSKREYKIACPIVSGRFPKWREAIPSAEPIGTARISPSQWVKAYQEWTQTHQISINGTCAVVSHAPELKADHSGSKIEFNGRLDNIVNHLESRKEDELTIGYWGPKKGLRIDSPESTFYIMPCTK